MTHSSAETQEFVVDAAGHGAHGARDKKNRITENVLHRDVLAQELRVTLRSY